MKLAKKLSELSGYSKVFYCNSGTEAVEAAIKLAFWKTKNDRVLSLFITHFTAGLWAPYLLKSQAKGTFSLRFAQLIPIMLTVTVVPLNSNILPAGSSVQKSLKTRFSGGN